MKRLIKKSRSQITAGTREVNPIRNGVCYVNDVSAFDFNNFDDSINYQFDSYDTYREWMKRYYES